MEKEERCFLKKHSQSNFKRISEHFIEKKKVFLLYFEIFEGFHIQS